MNVTKKDLLIEEGKQIIETTDEASWRLAEIVKELHDGGETYQAIADCLGWGNRSIASDYEKSLVVREQHSRFEDARLFGRMTEDRGIAVQAVADAEDISPHTAKTRASVKELVAEIADLPPDQKRQAAKDLAQDPTFVVEGLKSAGKELSDKRKQHRQSHGPVEELPTPLDDAVFVSNLDQADASLGTALYSAVPLSGDALEVAEASLKNIELSLEMIREKMNMDWDVALKELS